jgi:type I protein arginine methyltransferase
MTASATELEQKPASSNSSQVADVLDLTDDEGWEDAELEEEQARIISLLDNEVFPDVTSMLAHCKKRYDFDFLHIKNKFSLGFYGCIKLVNYIRSEMKSGRLVSSDILQTDFEIDKYLIPVLQDDALLFNLGDLPDVISDGKATDAEPGSCHETATLLARVAELEEELHKTQSQFLNYRETVACTLDERWNDGLLSRGALDGAATEEKRDDDSQYFSSYSYNGMLCTPFYFLCF